VACNCKAKQLASLGAGEPGFAQRRELGITLGNAGVARGDREGRARAGARHPRAGRGAIARIFMIMWIPQLMSCGIHMIMARAAVPAGQSGRNGHAWPGPGAKAERLRQWH
jgi:hypothetical protein